MSLGRRLPLILLVAVLGACSSATSTSTNGQPGAASHDPPSAPAEASTASAAGTVGQACDLLSEADIVELTTWSVTTATPGPQQGIYENGCHWKLEGGSTGVIPAELYLGIRGPGGRSYFDTFFAPMVDDGSSGYESIEAVGEVATTTGLRGSVMGVQGDVLVDVQWVNAGEDDTAVATSLLERVLANVAGS